MLFDIFPKALASVASFLFPLFASYKALNSADPAQLTPWLMYWVVLSVVVLFESWTDWILAWVPFYYYFRLMFLLYLVLPQTQGARVLYQTHLHPFLTEHEANIDEFIGSAHARLRSAGLHYLKQAIAQLKQALGLPTDPPAPPSPPPSSYAASAAASYTQSLLARFTLPNARWPGGAAGAGTVAGTGAGQGTTQGADFYGLLASAVGALGSATGAAGAAGAAGASSVFSRGFMGANTGTGATGSTSDRASFIATQRGRLQTLLNALEKEAADLEAEQGTTSAEDGSTLSRPLSGASGLSKSRSEADFEKIDAESGTEEDKPTRRRNAPNSAANQGPGAGKRTSSGSWMPWWGSSDAAAVADAASDAKSSSVDK